MTAEARPFAVELLRWFDVEIQAIDRPSNGMVCGAQTSRRALRRVCLDPILMSAKQSLAAGRFGRRAQRVGATLVRSLSAGVLNPNVSRGR